MTHSIQSLDHDALDRARGGAAAPPASQAQLRTMAQQYCPATYAKFKSAPEITRPMAERCLDEAGYGLFKGQLDRYFPKK